MHTKISKGAVSTLLAVLMIVVSLTGNLFYNQNSAAADDYHSWTQMDPRWGSVPMGNTTVAKSGCLITSLSIMTMHSQSIDSAALSKLGISSTSQFNPGVLANAYTANNGFTSGGAIASWGTIGRIIPNITFIKDANLSSTTQSGVVSELKQMLDSGTHVILNVNGYHWVYIEGVVGSKVYMIDPGSSETDLFAKYGVSGGNEYWALKGSKAPYYTSPAVTTTTTTKTTTTTVRTTTTTTRTTTTTAKTTTTTTTTTTTKTTTTTTVTTTTTTTTAPAYETGEYIYNGDDSVKVCSLTGGNGIVLASMQKGHIVEVISVYGSEGLVDLGGSNGWVELSKLTLVEDNTEHAAGDINNDGTADKYDLALLNEYLRLSSSMPEGISVFTANERKAADANGDGIIDKNDVLAFIMLICS